MPDIQKPKRKPHCIPMKDHLGNEYPSKAALLRAYDISDVSFDYRLKTLKWSLEKTLTTPKMDMFRTTAIACEDHLGNKFDTKAQMCDYWRIPRALFFKRMASKWSIEKALTTPPRRNYTQVKTISDGKKDYYNVDEMCKAYNITKTQYMINIRNNLSIAEALISKTEKRKHPIDHLGNEYNSINELCRAYNITKTTLRSRLELGWTLKEILTNPENNSHWKKTTDNQGNEFETQKQMLDHYDISYVVYKYRLKHNVDPSRLYEQNIHHVACEDHHGQQYNTVQDMLYWWNAITGTYHHHLKKYNNISAGLTSRLKIQKVDNDLTIISKIQDFYHVKYKNVEYMWRDDVVAKYYRYLKLKDIMLSDNTIRDIKILKVTDEYSVILYKTLEIIVPNDELFKRLFFVQKDKKKQKTM